MQEASIREGQQLVRDALCVGESGAKILILAALAFVIALLQQIVASATALESSGNDCHLRPAAAASSRNV
jgi:hypothetical protein